MRKFFTLRNIAAAATCLAAMAMFTACGDEQNDNNPFNPYGYGNSAGWPNNTILAEFGLSGLSAPAGATESWYMVVRSSGTEAVAIYFKGSAAADGAINGYYTSHGWEEYMSGEGSGTNMWYYKKTGFLSWYSRDANNQCHITSTKHNEGYDD